MPSRTKLMLSLALFAPAALIVLTGPSPAAVSAFLGGAGGWTRPSQRSLTLSLMTDGLALLACVAACWLILRLAQRLRDRVPFGLTMYILALFLVCFCLWRIAEYALALGGPRGHLETDLLMVQAAASVVVAMCVAVLFPYVRTMVRAVLSANKEHEKFIVAAESSLDAFYILESVRDETKGIVDFRFAYVNANGEKRLRRPRAELVGEMLSQILPYTVRVGLIERYKQVVETGVPL